MTALPNFRILHVVAPAEVGGLETVLAALARGQASRGHAVTVVSVIPPDGRPGRAFLTGQDGVEHIRLNIRTRAYLRERQEVVALCRRMRPDVVHTHGFRPDVVDAQPARRAGAAIVTTVHGFTGATVRGRLYERLQLRAFRRFDAVVAVSRPLRDQLIELGVPASRVKLVVNGWDGTGPLVAREEARRRLGVRNGAFHIGYVGRLSLEKGADVLLEAVALMPDIGREVRVSVIGDGPQRGWLETRARELGLDTRVQWHGTLPDAGELFAGFDAFALSSRTEGTPMVLFEAMRAETPIVATAVGGVPDLVAEEGLLVPSEEPSALARALATVAGEPKHAAGRARRARETLEVKYALEPWVGAYDEVYAGIIGKTNA